MLLDNSVLIRILLICCVSNFKATFAFDLSSFTWDTTSVLSNNKSKRLSSSRWTCLFAHRMPPLSSEEEYNRARRNLELRWKLMQSNDECDLEDMNSCGGPCEDCEGEGVVECRFCQGTGFLTIGETIYKGKDCPVCSGSGEEECKSCMGRKWVAKWRQIDPSLLAGSTKL
jgi:DnaJ-class molecular chaperone